VFQFFVGLLLGELGIFEFCYELLLFHLHFGYVGFVVRTLLVFAVKLLVHLLASLVFLLELVLPLATAGFLLLGLDKLFDHVGFGHVLVVLVSEHVLVEFLLFLCITDFLLDSISHCLFVHFDFLLLLLLLGLVVESLDSFFVLALLHSVVLLHLVLQVSFSLGNNFMGLLAGHIDLLVGSVFLLLEQVDPVGEQLEVLFGTLSGYLSGHQLAVQSLVVVFFVWSQVNLLFLWLHLFLLHRLLVEVLLILNSLVLIGTHRYKFYC